MNAIGFQFFNVIYTMAIDAMLQEKCPGWKDAVFDFSLESSPNLAIVKEKPIISTATESLHVPFLTHHLYITSPHCTLVGGDDLWHYQD